MVPTSLQDEPLARYGVSREVQYFFPSWGCRMNIMLLPSISVKNTVLIQEDIFKKRKRRPLSSMGRTIIIVTIASVH